MKIASKLLSPEIKYLIMSKNTCAQNEGNMSVVLNQSIVALKVKLISQSHLERIFWHKFEIGRVVRKENFSKFQKKNEIKLKWRKVRQSRATLEFQVKVFLIFQLDWKSEILDHFSPITILWGEDVINK